MTSVGDRVDACAVDSRQAAKIDNHSPRTPRGRAQHLREPWRGNAIQLAGDADQRPAGVPVVQRAAKRRLNDSSHLRRRTRNT
jgi:hypothetical protein